MRFPWAMNARVIVLGVAGVMAAAVLIVARQPSRPADVETADAQLEANARPEKAATVVPLQTKKAVESKAPASAVVAKRHAGDTTVDNTPALESVKAPIVERVATSPTVESAVKTPVAESPLKTPAVESVAKADVQKSASVTITGCLTLDEETFWLKDTSGTDAPQSRSWRSGFLKKRSSQIALVDATNALKLPDHVGQRVAATGVLVNREMRVHSLHRVATSCN
jgi:hypothetical protein